MRTYDISTLWRPTLVEAARHARSDANYPPFNVERLSDDPYRISLALAGFFPDEFALTARAECARRLRSQGRQEFPPSGHLVAARQAAVQSGRPWSHRGSTV